MEFYTASKQIYMDITDDLGLSNVLAEIAEIYVDTGRADEAIKTIAEAAEPAQRSENRYALAKCVGLSKEAGVGPG